MKKTEKYRIILLYILLTAGGLWHILGYFDVLMREASGPLIITLSIWLFFEHLVAGNLNRTAKIRFLVWSLAVFVLSFIIETIGMKTGLIFGEYLYGPVLKPQISGVPIAIGSAWFTMLICSAAITQKYEKTRVILKPVAQVFLIAFLMLLFDFIMEPAAIKLNYWRWESDFIPIQNYIAWFILGFLFSTLGSVLGVFKNRIPPVALHAYFAQLIYFVLIIFS
jgi:putative membrane protein